jgi:hypothetical protein
MFLVKQLDISHPDLICENCGSLNDLYTLQSLSSMSRPGCLLLCRECREELVREMKLKGAIDTDMIRYSKKGY